MRITELTRARCQCISDAMRLPLQILLGTAMFASSAVVTPTVAQGIPGPNDSIPGLPGLLGEPAPKISAAEAEKRAKGITIPIVNFTDVSPADVLSALRGALFDRASVRSLKHPEVDIQFSMGVHLLPETARVKLKRRDASLHQLLAEIAAQCNLVLSFADGAASLSTKEEVADRNVVLTNAQNEFLKHAEKVVLPDFTVEAMPLPELIKHLNARAKEADPEKRGVPIELSPAAAKAETKLTLNLHNVPVSEVVNHVVNLAALRKKVGDMRFVLAAHGEG